jgi:hypothetical protein
VAAFMLIKTVNEASPADQSATPRRVRSLTMKLPSAGSSCGVVTRKLRVTTSEAVALSAIWRKSLGALWRKLRSCKSSWRWRRKTERLRCSAFVGYNHT